MLTHHNAGCKAVRLAVQDAECESDDDWCHNDSNGGGDHDDDARLFASGAMSGCDTTKLKREWANENPRIWDMDDLLEKNKVEEWKGVGERDFVIRLELTTAGRTRQTTLCTDLCTTTLC